MFVRCPTFLLLCLKCDYDTVGSTQAESHSLVIPLLRIQPRSDTEHGTRKIRATCIEGGPQMFVLPAAQQSKTTYKNKTSMFLTNILQLWCSEGFYITPCQYIRDFHINGFFLCPDHYLFI